MEMAVILARETAQPESKREQILRVAEEVFAEKGFKSTTMKDIAEGVGIKAPALYNHFRNKEDIYDSVIIECYNQLRVNVLKPIQEAPGLREKIRLLIVLLIDFWAEHPRLPRIFAQEVLQGGELLFTDLVPNFMIPLFNEIVDVLEEKERDEHGFRKVDMPQLVFNIFGVTMFNFFSGPFFTAVISRDSTSPERIARFKQETIDLVFHGIEK